MFFSFAPVAVWTMCILEDIKYYLRWYVNNYPVVYIVSGRYALHKPAFFNNFSINYRKHHNMVYTLCIRDKNNSIEGRDIQIMLLRYKTNWRFELSELLSSFVNKIYGCLHCTRAFKIIFYNNRSQLLSSRYFFHHFLK